MMIYDAVVLAAGRNTRLKGTVPAFLKPLVIINGKPLIVDLVESALLNCEHVAVVVSPQNCAAIIDVLESNLLLDEDVSVVVQPTARGPGEALYRGLRCCRSERTLLLLGDNIVPHGDVLSVLENDRKHHQQHNVTAAVMLTSNTATSERFTRVAQSGEFFVEGEPFPPWDDNKHRCWVGPLALDSRMAERCYHSLLDDPEELKISEPLNNVPGLRVHTVVGSALDIGTSHALLEVSENG